MPPLGEQLPPWVPAWPPAASAGWQLPHTRQRWWKLQQEPVPGRRANGLTGRRLHDDAPLPSPLPLRSHLPSASCASLRGDVGGSSRMSAAQAAASSFRAATLARSGSWPAAAAAGGGRLRADARDDTGELGRPCGDRGLGMGESMSPAEWVDGGVKSQPCAQRWLGIRVSHPSPTFGSAAGQAARRGHHTQQALGARLAVGVDLRAGCVAVSVGAVSTGAWGGGHGTQHGRGRL
jgi:hypothetical protein